MTFANYMELCKMRIGVIIALTAIIGYMAVAETVEAVTLVALSLAMLLGSASSSVFNHLYERDLDARMTRTRGRPMVTASPADCRRVLAFALALLVAGVGLAGVALNWLVAAHLFLGAFVYAIVYTVWLKRRTWWNIVVGGAAGSFAVLAGAAAVDPGVWSLPLLMAVTLFLWTPSHFWALALLLRDDYRAAGVPMLPAVTSARRSAEAILINSVLLVASTLLPWMLGELGAVYGVISLLFGAWFLLGTVALLRAPEDRTLARRTFFGSMVYLMGVFLAVLLDKHLPMMWT
ncbi:protoheme IX farnesyltransferase [Roseospira marina]|uniref:Protoheme IX farnesyltransferase n=1 Tax=Roseospira marina TaxID=140057 RepID=A0A5M6ID61_9PROT|nr:heme o synthase [Roseospira marina]KAA5606214.1 protoheme IX farnesyltransferase [Roseospira marina]MBB4314363.1 protoheme IX farnesyltransferase [Roseospira marina]MBB5087523.1 protoheme IX farnesyltransferase [Roseospira marina]